jgi:hypothetical protein
VPSGRSASGGRSPAAWWRLRSARRYAAASSWPSAGATWSSLRAACTCGRRSCAAASVRPRRAPRGACSSSAPYRRHAAGAVAGKPLPGRQQPRVLPPGARLAARPEQAVEGRTCARRWPAPASRSRSARGTTSATLPSRTRRPPATRRRTCSSRLATRRAPSPSGTSTPLRCCSPAPPPRGGAYVRRPASPGERVSLGDLARALAARRLRASHAVSLWFAFGYQHLALVLPPARGQAPRRAAEGQSRD